MRVKELHPRFGLEILDFSARSSDASIAEGIRNKLEAHGLLLFRNQIMEDEDLVRFSKSIGDGRLDQSARRIAHSASCIGVNYLTNLRDGCGKPIGFAGSDTDFWHSDQEYRRSPATLSTLYCLIPSSEGGATSFASTLVANSGISPDIIAQLRAMRSTRRPAESHDNVERIEVSHPVIMTSPRSHKETIYVSEHTLQFSGKETAEGQSLKKSILEHILAEDNIYRHQWRFGDLLLYDNAQLLHRREAFKGLRWLKATKIFAPKDYFAVPQGEVVSQKEFDG